MVNSHYYNSFLQLYIVLNFFTLSVFNILNVFLVRIFF